MKKFLNFLKFLLLIIGVFGLTFVLVWPLWKFATALPNIYTIVVLTVLCLGFILLIVKRIKRHAKK